MHFMLISSIWAIALVVLATGFADNSRESGPTDPKITVIDDRNNFIEDKVTKFRCIVNNEEEVTWMIKDRKNMAIFYDSNTTRNQTSPRKLNSDHEDIFSLVMRRDFSGKDVVCRTAGGREGRYRVESVTETIPIDGVDLHGVDVITGHRIKLTCDVKARPGIVKYVTFRIDDKIIKVQRREPIGDSLTRYEYVSDRTIKASLGVHNGMRIQCYAATKSFKSSFGSVMSPLKKLIVHEFTVERPTSYNETIMEGLPDFVKFNVTANPPPQPNQISVVHRDVSGVEKKFSSETNVKQIGKFTYEISIEFVPEDVGLHEIRVNTKMFNKIVHKWRILFYKFSFGPDFKQLPMDHKDDIKTINFTMNLHYHPLPKQFKCIAKSNDERYDIAIPKFTKVHKVKNRTVSYNVTMRLIPAKTSGCQLLFIKKDRNEVWGPTLQIGQPYRSLKNGLTFIFAIWIAMGTFISGIIMGIILGISFLKMKKKASQGPQNSRPEEEATAPDEILLEKSDRGYAEDG